MRVRLKVIGFRLRSREGKLVVIDGKDRELYIGENLDAIELFRTRYLEELADFKRRRREDAIARTRERIKAMTR